MVSRLNRTVVFLVFSNCVVAFLGTTMAVDKPTPQFNITTQRPDDKVAFKTEGDKTEFTIRSPFGISNAVIQRMGEKWPKAIVLRLHLKGLESLRIQNDKWTLAAAVSSHRETPRVRLWKDKKEDHPIDTKSPYWMQILTLGSDRKPTTDVPLNEGYFEMQLPVALFEDNPESITIHWIDFYRG